MTETPSAIAIQFNGLDDYHRILAWMKDCGDTSALADEVQYMTPIMLLKTATGTAAVRLGEWVMRKSDGSFDVASPAMTGTEARQAHFETERVVIDSILWWAHADDRNHDSPALDEIRQVMGRFTAAVPSGTEETNQR